MWFMMRNTTNSETPRVPTLPTEDPQTHRLQAKRRPVCDRPLGASAPRSAPPTVCPYDGIVPKVRQRGEAVDPTSYYFRINPMFETAAQAYDWLNRIVAVGIGHRQADGPVYSVFEVLRCDCRDPHNRG